MPGFIYFIPDKSTVNPAVLAEAGLEYLVPANAMSQRQVGAGPSKGPGLVVCRNEVVPEGGLKYKSETQTWVDAGKYWVGRQKDVEITPGDLERDSVSGYPVSMQDGAHWFVPILRVPHPDGPPDLMPQFQTYKRGPDGWKTELPAQYEAMGRRVERGWVSVANRLGLPVDDEEIEPLGDSELIDLAMEALAMNYFVDPQGMEISELGIIGPNEVLACLGCLVDLPTVRELMEGRADPDKKKEHSTPPDSGDGTEGS